MIGKQGAGTSINPYP